MQTRAASHLRAPPRLLCSSQEELPHPVLVFTFVCFFPRFLLFSFVSFPFPSLPNPSSSLFPSSSLVSLPPSSSSSAFSSSSYSFFSFPFPFPPSVLLPPSSFLLSSSSSSFFSHDIFSSPGLSLNPLTVQKHSVEWLLCFCFFRCFSERKTTPEPLCKVCGVSIAFTERDVP